MRQQISITLAVIMVFICMAPASAALPTPVAPTTAPAAGDWLGEVTQYAKDAGTVLALIISMASFIICSWALVAKFNEARQRKRPYTGKRSIALGFYTNIRTPKKGATEWGEVGLLAVIAGVLLVANAYFLNEALGII